MPPKARLRAARYRTVTAAAGSGTQTHLRHKKDQSRTRIRGRIRHQSSHSAVPTNLLKSGHGQCRFVRGFFVGAADCGRGVVEILWGANTQVGKMVLTPRRDGTSTIELRDPGDGHSELGVRRPAVADEGAARRSRETLHRRSAMPCG